MDDGNKEASAVRAAEYVASENAIAGTMAVVFEQKLTGMLVSIMVLGTLVNIAFLGFYYPQLRTALRKRQSNMGGRPYSARVWWRE